MDCQGTWTDNTRRYFICSEAIFDIQQCHGGYLGNLPKVLMVRQGYRGNTEAESLEIGQVIRINEASKRKRVMGKDIKQRYLSVGINIPTEFQLLDKKKRKHGKPALLSRLLEKHSLPFVTKFSPDDLKIDISPRKIDADKFGPITFERIYEERFLIGNTVCGGKLNANGFILPMYVEAKVSAVTGFNCSSSGQEHARTSWQQFLQCMEEDPNKTGCNTYSSTLEKELVIYDSDKIKVKESEPIYDAIQPSIYGKLMYCDENSSIYSHLETESNDYEISPVSAHSVGESRCITPIIATRALQEKRSRPRPLVPEKGLFTNQPHQTEAQKSNIHQCSKGGDCEKPPLPERRRAPPKFASCGTPGFEQSTRNVIQNSEQRATPLSFPGAYNDKNQTNDKTLDVRKHTNRDNQSTHVPRKFHLESINSDKQYESSTQLSNAGDNRKFTKSQEYPVVEDCSKQHRQNMLSMKVKDVSEVLLKLNLNEYVDSFTNNLIDGELLSDFDERILISEFGFTKIQAMRLQKFITTGHIPR